MKHALLALTSLIALSAHAQKAQPWPPSSTWYQVQHQGWPWVWTYSPATNDTAVFAYPASSLSGKSRDQWVNQALTRQVQGDIRGKTITITFTVNPGPGGQWFGRYYISHPQRKCDVRLFMIGYDSLYAQVSNFTPNLPDLTQWGRFAITLPETPITPLSPNTHTLSFRSDDPLAWSNVNGLAGTSAICASNVKQIGLCFSGQSPYYSTGITAPAPEGASITVNSFSVQ